MNDNYSNNNNNNTTNNNTANTTNTTTTTTTTTTATNTSTRARGNASELPDFLISLDSYSSTVPEAVAQYYMETSGVTIKDPRLPKLLALAADKFLAETIHQAREIAAMKVQNMKSTLKRKNELQDNFEIEDLEAALAQQRIHVRKRALVQSNKED